MTTTPTEMRELATPIDIPASRAFLAKCWENGGAAEGYVSGMLAKQQAAALDEIERLRKDVADLRAMLLRCEAHLDDHYEADKDEFPGDRLLRDVRALLKRTETK